MGRSTVARRASLAVVLLKAGHGAPLACLATRRPLARAPPAVPEPTCACRVARPLEGITCHTACNAYALACALLALLLAAATATIGPLPTHRRRGNGGAPISPKTSGALVLFPSFSKGRPFLTMAPLLSGNRKFCLGSNFYPLGARASRGRKPRRYWSPLPSVVLSA